MSEASRARWATRANGTNGNGAHESAPVVSGQRLSDAFAPAVGAAKPAFLPKWEWVTPAMAKDYLSSSGGNRSLSAPLVEELIDEARKGFFFPTHQGIAFDISGRLRDGHHRMWMVAKSGVAVWILVTRDVPDEACDAIDSGRVRSVADVLHLRSKFGDHEAERDAKHAHLRVATYRTLEILEAGSTAGAARSSIARFRQQKSVWETSVDGFEQRFGTLAITLPSDGGRKTSAIAMHIACFCYAWEPYPEAIAQIVDGIKRADVYREDVRAAINVMTLHRGHNRTFVPAMHRLLRVLAASVAGEKISLERTHATRIGYDFFRRAREVRGMHFRAWADDPAMADSNTSRFLMRFAERDASSRLTPLVCATGHREA